MNRAILAALVVWLVVPAVAANAALASSQPMAESQNTTAGDKRDSTETTSAFLEVVVVTGTRTEKLLSEVPIRTELISRDLINASSARCLADVIEFTPGVRVLNSCQNCNFSTLSMLGLEGKYSQLLFDSQPVFNSLSMVYGLEQIPSEMIERIEIIKGGGSAMYGPGAVGGVVNIIPREPSESGAVGYFRAEDMDGVTNWSAGFSGSASSRDKKIGFGFYGQNDHISEYDRNGDGFTDIGRRDLNAFGGRFVRHFGDDGKITLDYGHLYEDRRGGDHLDNPPFKTEITEWIRSSRDAASFAMNNRIGNSCDYSVSVSYANMNRKTYYGAGGDPDAYGLTDNPLWVMGGQLNHYLDKHTLSWGVQHTSDHLQDNHPGYNRTIDQHYRNSGLFVQDDWMISKPLALIVGARIDKHSELNDPIISPRMALKYAPNPVVTVRGSASTGFLAPQTFDEDLHILIAGGEGQVIRNSDDLKEESSQSYTLGIELTPRLGGGNLLFELNGFHTNLDDAFVLTDAHDDPLTDQVEMTRINGGGAHVTGAEITGGYMQGRFEGQIGWIQQIAEYDEVQDFDTKNFFRLPEDSAVGKLYWRDLDLVSAFVGLRYQGKMYMPHYAGWIDDDVLEHVDSFFIVDVSLSHRFWIDDDHLTLTLGVRNLTDDFQEDMDLGPDRDAGYVYGPRNPRTWYASLKYGF